MVGGFSVSVSFLVWMCLWNFLLLVVCWIDWYSCCISGVGVLLVMKMLY